MAVILSQQAENAIYAANHVRALVPVPSKSRWRWRQPKSARPHPVELEMTVARVVAIAEDYLLIRATFKLKPALLASVPPPSSPDPVTSQLRKAAKSFPVLVKLWTDDLKVDPATSASQWSEFEVARDLRHVLVHRLGMWQPGLDPKPTLKKRMAVVAANPDAYRGRIPLSDVDLSDVVGLAAQIVGDLDPLT